MKRFIYFFINRKIIDALKTSINRTISKKDVNEICFYDNCDQLLKKKMRSDNEYFNEQFKLVILKLFIWCVYKKENIRKNSESNVPYTVSEHFKHNIERIEKCILSNYSSKIYSNDKIMLKVCYKNLIEFFKKFLINFAFVFKSV